MINNQLLDYVKQQLSLGSSRESVFANLKSAGWTEADINETFLSILPKNTSSFTSSSQNNSLSELQSETQLNLQQLEQDKQKIISSFGNTSSTQIHKSKKILLTSFIIFILLCAIGGVAYAYFSGMFISLSSLASKSIDNMKVASGANYDTTISVDFSEIKGVTENIGQMLSGVVVPTKINFTSKGAYDFSVPENKKFSSLFSIDAGVFSTAIDFRATDNVLYAELTKSPTLAFLPMLANYENKWFSFPFKSENSSSLDNSLNPTDMITGNTNNILSKLTAEQKNQFYEITRNAHFVKVVKRLLPDTINGTLSYHFTFDIDRTGISNYLQALKGYINTVGKDDSQLSSFDPTSFSKNLDNIEDFKGEIWIGRKDSLPYKMIISFSIKPDLKKNEKIKINIVNIFSNWNKPDAIIAPTDSTSFEKFLSDSMMEATQKGKDAAIENSIKNLRGEAEILFSNSSSYSGFCVSKKLKAAKKEVEASGGKEFICKDSRARYAVSVKLSSDSGYFCIDFSGTEGITKNKLISTTCSK